MLSRVLFYFFWYLFLFLRGTFERSLQVSWCCLNCSSPGAHSSPAGRPGLPALFFILARKMEMFFGRNLFVDSNVEKHGGDVEGHRLDLLERKESVDPVLD